MAEPAQQYDPARAYFGKARYGDEGTALGVAAKCFDQRGVLLRAYQCAVAGCFGWHLTKTDIPEQKPGWRPPAKSKRQVARERHAEQLKRRKR